MPPHHPPHPHLHGHHPHHRRHDGPLIDLLRFHLDAHRGDLPIEQIGDIVRKYGDTDAVEFLESTNAETWSPDLIIDGLAFHLKLRRHHRIRSLVSDLAEGAGTCAAVLPVPPHIIDELAEVPSLTFVVPAGHHPPPHLRGSDRIPLLQGRAARGILSAAPVVIFEAFIQDEGLYVPDETADLVDPRLLAENARVAVHRRLERHRQDVPLVLSRPILTI